MSRISFVVVVLLQTTFASFTYAQDASRQFNIGLVTGINFSYFNDRIGEFGHDDDYESFVRISPMFGIDARYQLTEILAFRSALLYNLRGGAYRDESGVARIGGNGDEKSYYVKNYRLNYIEVPIIGEVRLLNLKHWNKMPFELKLAAGLSCGIPVESSLRYNGFAPTGSTTGPLINVEEEYHVMEIGHANSPVVNSIAEVCFDFVNGHNTKLFVRLGISTSLTKVYDQNEIDGYNFFTGITTCSLTAGRYLFK